MTNEQKQSDVMLTRPAWSRPLLSTDRDEVRSAIVRYELEGACVRNAKVLVQLHAGGIVRDRIVAVISEMAHFASGVRIGVGEIASVTRVKR